MGNCFLQELRVYEEAKKVTLEIQILHAKNIASLFTVLPVGFSAVAPQGLPLGIPELVTSQT